MASAYVGTMGPFHLSLKTSWEALNALVDVEAKEESSDEPPTKRIKTDRSDIAERYIPLMIYDCDVKLIDEENPDVLINDPLNLLNPIFNTPLPLEWEETETSDSGIEVKLVLRNGKRTRHIGTFGDKDSTSFPRLQEFLEMPMHFIKEFQVKKSFRNGVELYNSPIDISTVFKTSSTANHICIRIEIRWKDGYSYLDGPKAAQVKAKNFLNICFPDLLQSQTVQWVPRDFYENAHIPPRTIETWSELDSADMESKLYPFQKRAVQFMLQREGGEVVDGKIVTNPDFLPKQPSQSLYSEQFDGIGNKFYASRILGSLTRHPIEPSSTLRGGILSEEMGLGKTVEIIALITLHRRLIENPVILAPKGEDFWRTLKVSGATLIITPVHLVNQWRDELAFHAPKLSVFYYKGVKSYRDVDLSTFDVVLTTYPVLAKEIHYVQDTKPLRNLRGQKRYQPPKSPITEISWWRVCLDEAQQVDSGTSQAAQVARHIPRVNAWAVSGTPFKRHVEDLGGLLLFLHCEPYNNPKIWARVDKSVFKDLFGKIAIRHTKQKIREELDLPEQKRLVVSIPFTVFEEQQYRDLFEKMCSECGFAKNGTALGTTEDPVIIEKMRIWLRRLRQMCLHVGVGKFNRKILAGSGPLRTLGEVLESAISLLVTRIRASRRAIIQSTVRQGHIHAFNNSDPNKAEFSHSFYSKALEQAISLVEECRQDEFIGISDTDKKSSTNYEKDEMDLENHTKKQTSKLSHDLRSALEMEHLCRFYVATAMFQMGEVPEVPQDIKDGYHAKELAEYAIAKTIRQELLAENRQEAEDYMLRVSDWQIEEIPKANLGKDFNSIDTMKHLDRIRGVYDFLNRQKALLDEWRKRAADVLLKPLVDTEKEGVEDTGEEYESSTKDQDALYSLFDALRAICAERKRYLTGQTNMLVEHEVSVALMRAKEEQEALGDGESSELFLGLMKAWDEVKAVDNTKAENRTIPSLVYIRDTLRPLSFDLQRELDSGRAGFDRVTSDRNKIRITLIKNLSNSVSETYDAQMKVLLSLEKEIDLFRQCMNHRLEYYRRLQAISDTVEPYKETPDDELDTVELGRAETQEQKSQQELIKLEDRHRFYRNQKQNSTDVITCPVCMDTFEHGVLTPCGHHCCKECSNNWFSHNTKCPVCRHTVTLSTLQNILYKPQIVQADEDQTLNEAGPSSIAPRRSTIYSEINTTILNEIKVIDLPVSYGTKIDWIARHLIWLRNSQPGAQVVLCSQFREFLDTLTVAFRRFGIRFETMYNGPGGIDRFRHNRTIQCFLLDTKSNSSGLNLVNATHVLLCEPLINAALELQVIARVHRIGQMKSTTVWMTLISDTVEQAVYDLSVGRRLAHVARRRAAEMSQEAAIEAVDSMELEGQPTEMLLNKSKNSEGELVDNDDLWSCLFGKGLRPGPDSAELGRTLRATAAELRELNG